MFLTYKKKILRHCVSGMQPSQYKGQILHKQEFRMKLKGEIKW